MKRVLPALLAAACSTTVTNVSSGEFIGPAGVAATSAGDRDLVFIANSGRDGLIALQLCNKPLLADGGVDPADKCASSNESAQFIPGPIRVFPANIESAARTTRVAGARLLLPDGGVPDGGANGEALAVGADNTVRVVDARRLVDAEHGLLAPDAGVLLPPLQIGAAGVDIVAGNPLDPNLDVETAAASVKVFVATAAPAQLLALTASLDVNGAAQLPSIDGRCDLGAVLPTRLALAPGKADVVYVADGAGDGVVGVPTSAIAAGGPCPMTRISAGGHAVQALALSPPWYEAGGATHPTGEILMMVLKPLTAVQPGKPLEAGGILFARTSDRAIVPIPPFPESGYESDGGPAVEPDGGPAEPMQPLQPSGLAREGVFLRAIRPGGTCASAPCTPLYLGTGVSPTGVVNFALLAVVGSTDGSTWFIDVPDRRFVNTNFYGLGVSSIALTPVVNANPLTGTNVIPISPGETAPNPPVPPILTVDTQSTTAGVTHSAQWRVIWHSPLVGLDTRAGTLTRVDASTFKFVTPPADLGNWTRDPVFHLGPGDVAAFAAFASADLNCQDLVTTLNKTATTAVSQIELPILAVSNDTLTLGAGGVALTDACASVGAVAQVRIAGIDPWLIFEGNTAVARWHTGAPFTATEPRFDYPYDPCDRTLPGIPCYDRANPPVATQNVSFRFTITGNDPILPISNFTFSMNSFQAPLAIRDPGNTVGLVGGILAYSSPRIESLVYSVLTGANEMLQIDPAIPSTNGIQVYR